MVNHKIDRSGIPRDSAGGEFALESAQSASQDIAQISDRLKESERRADVFSERVRIITRESEEFKESLNKKLLEEKRKRPFVVYFVVIFVILYFLTYELGELSWNFGVDVEIFSIFISSGALSAIVAAICLILSYVLSKIVSRIF